jgi:hypothetical protein
MDPPILSRKNLWALVARIMSEEATPELSRSSAKLGRLVIAIFYILHK